MKRAAAIALLLAPSASLAASTHVTPFEMRLVVDCKPGMASVPYRHNGMTDQLCLAPLVIVSRPDIIAASIVHTPYGTDAIRIAVRDEAATRVNQQTAANVNRRFAFLYDGHVVAAPVLHEPITDNQIEFDMLGPGDMIEKAAADLAGEDRL